MKTSEKLSFPALENEYLENILRQLVSKHAVLQLFFTRTPNFAQLVVHVGNSSDAAQLQQQKWVGKVLSRYQTAVCFFNSGRLSRLFSMGHPFVESYCRPSAVLYENAAAGNLLAISRGWKSYKKKLDAFEWRFHHDHDLHLSHVQDLIATDADGSALGAYAKLLAYDLDYLEELWTGRKNDSLRLEERIDRLLPHVPQIQRYFVRSRGGYYLADLFEETKESLFDDASLCKSELLDAVGKAEEGLYHLAEARLAALRKRLKKGNPAKQGVAASAPPPKNAPLGTATDMLAGQAGVEQAYLFHQGTDGDQTAYYLLLIGKGLGNEKLRQLAASLQGATEGTCRFVLIGHDRGWMQSNLYRFQHFFAGIVQHGQLVYSSSRYHPEFHWEVPHHPFHADLHFFYQSTRQTAQQFSAIAGSPAANYYGLDPLFALFFLSFCRTYLYVKTYYLPNCLSSRTLWELCLYADTALRKHSHLLEQFPADIFGYLDRHSKVFHKLSRLDREQVAQMHAIVQALMGELEAAAAGTDVAGGH